MSIQILSYAVVLSTLFGLIVNIIKICFSKWKSSEDMERVLLFFILTIITIALISYQQTH